MCRRYHLHIDADGVVLDVALLVVGIDFLEAGGTIVIIIDLARDILDVGGLPTIAVVEDDAGRCHTSQCGGEPLRAVGRCGDLSHQCAGPCAVDGCALGIPRVEIGSLVCTYMHDEFLCRRGIVLIHHLAARVSVVGEIVVALGQSEDVGRLAFVVARLAVVEDDVHLVSIDCLDIPYGTVAAGFRLGHLGAGPLAVE